MPGRYVIGSSDSRIQTRDDSLLSRTPRMEGDTSMRHSATPSEVVADVRALALTRRESPVLIAIDGRSGAGKSTLAHELAKSLNAVVVEADDFYSGGSLTEWTQRPGLVRLDLCIDWRRLRRDALVPLLTGHPATWRSFDWNTEASLSATPTVLHPAGVVILAGAFSSRPELLDLIDYSIVVQTPADVRRDRLEKREGEAFIRDWHPIWNEAENYYFEHVRRREDFDAEMGRSLERAKGIVDS